MAGLTMALSMEPLVRRFALTAAARLVKPLGKARTNDAQTGSLAQPAWE
jgi:hypothetical protein